MQSVFDFPCIYYGFLHGPEYIEYHHRPLGTDESNKLHPRCCATPHKEAICLLAVGYGTGTIYHQGFISFKVEYSSRNPAAVGRQGPWGLCPKWLLIPGTVFASG
jgi:hypothetical protein